MYLRLITKITFYSFIINLQFYNLSIHSSFLFFSRKIDIEPLFLHKLYGWMTVE